MRGESNNSPKDNLFSVLFPASIKKAENFEEFSFIDSTTVTLVSAPTA